MSNTFLIVTDIFGRCRGLDRLLSDLAALSLHCSVLDPYQGQRQHFANEQQAYAAYLAQCGHAAYATRVAEALRQVQPQWLLGFSAGASALWHALGQTLDHPLAEAQPCAIPKPRHAWLFYPGQLHHYVRQTPSIPTTLWLAGAEPNYQVDAMLEQLQHNPRVQAHNTATAHGFMNPASKAFCETAYRHYLDLLTQQLNLVP